MNVLDPWDKLLVELARLLLLKPLMSHYVVEELASGTKLHDKKKLTLRLYDLQQTNAD
jgi:hypothetical protein